MHMEILHSSDRLIVIDVWSSLYLKLNTNTVSLLLREQIIINLNAGNIKFAAKSAKTAKLVIRNKLLHFPRDH